MAGVGKVSFDVKALEENVRAFADAVTKAKPAGAKGNYVKKVSVTSTMGPGLKLDLASLSVPEAIHPDRPLRRLIPKRIPGLERGPDPGSEKLPDILSEIAGGSSLNSHGPA